MTLEQATRLATSCALLMCRDRAMRQDAPLTVEDYNDIAGQITLLSAFQFVSCIDIVLAVQDARRVLDNVSLNAAHRAPQL